MRRLVWLGTLFVLLGAIASVRSQVPLKHDFLTDDEVDQIRDAQDPNERVDLYLKFARLRVELLRQEFAVEKPGRAKSIHDNLDDYRRIIEAMDTVIDDGLSRGQNMKKGMSLVTSREKTFLGQLQQLAARPARDSAYYQFALKDALETTQDSLTDSQQDLGQRSSRIHEEDARDKKKIESLEASPPHEAKTDQKTSDTGDAKPKRKAPTLRRKNEVPPDEQQP